MKENINAVRQEHEIGPDCSKPYVYLQLNTITIVAIYNQHTLNAYTKFPQRLTSKQMYNEFTGAVAYFLSHTKTKNLLVIGDANIDESWTKYVICAVVTVPDIRNQYT